jgi:thiol-disulfide isomerase/thioredoxin
MAFFKFKLSKMIYIRLLLIILFNLIINNENLFGQKAEVIKLEGLQEIIEAKTGNVKVINFWATWCKPCIKELPYFENIERSLENRTIEVFLISIDFVEDFESKLLSFIEKRKLNSTIKLLDETDYNSFIDKIDKRWSGAIPATLVIDSKNGKRLFIEKELKEGELEEILINFIKSS